mgnify:CR=1 FL=1
MRVLFISNYFNHHQKPLSDALFQLTAQQYAFAATVPLSQERNQMGWTDTTEEYTRDVDSISLPTQINQADVIITGSAPEEYVKIAIRKKKLIFRYSERPLKNGVDLRKYLPRFVRWHWRNPPGKPIYLLSASAFAAADYKKFGLFRERAYKWGYFPETRRYAHINSLIAGKDRSSILWVGRFLDWKHPDAALQAVRTLHNEGLSFHLNLIGTGEMEEF